jgi:hypothetical protein
LILKEARVIHGPQSQWTEREREGNEVLRQAFMKRCVLRYDVVQIGDSYGALQAQENSS